MRKSPATEPEEIGVNDLRQTLASTLNRIAVRGKVVYITSRGNRLVAIVPVPMAEEMERRQAS